MKLHSSIFQLLAISFFIILSISCERSVPKDVMFCKSWEVLVLEKPFDKESALIVMYRGDEVKLVGDTMYHSQIDSTKKDSSDFSVKVSAKRGVVGWVHIKELQKERIRQYLQRKPASNSSPLKKSEKNSADSSTLKVDSVNTLNISNKTDSIILNKNN
jgi:hypothetical protein